MDKKLIKKYLDNLFLSEQSSPTPATTPAIKLAKKMGSDNGKINKTGVEAIGKDMKDIEKAQAKPDTNQKTMAQNKFNYTDDNEKKYHDEMEIMNGQEMIQYDRKPSAEFTKKAEKAIKGDSTLGNNPKWANVVVKGQGGDEKFGEELIKKIKSSEKKRSEQTPTTKMFGDDWEVVKDKSHKSYATENANTNKKQISELGPSSLGYSGANDIPRDWFKFGVELAMKKMPFKTITDMFHKGSGAEEEATKGYLSVHTDSDIAGDNYEDSDRAARYGSIQYESTNSNKKPNSNKVPSLDKKASGLPAALKGKKSADGKSSGADSSGTDSSVRSPTSTDVRSPTRTATSTDAYTSGNVTVTGGAGAGANTTVNIEEPNPKQKAMNKTKSKTGASYKDNENNKPKIKESMKRLKFKKEFNGVGNALKLIPESYMVNNKVFEMTDGNEKYRIRWEGSLTEGKAVILTAADNKMVNEDIQKMKHLFNYNSQETIGTLKGKARIDENKVFSDIWAKTKQLMESEDIEDQDASVSDADDAVSYASEAKKNIDGSVKEGAYDADSVEETEMTDDELTEAIDAMLSDSKMEKDNQFKNKK